MKATATHEWRQTLHGEWLCDELGVILWMRDQSWFGYAFVSGARFGPYGDFDEAKVRIADAMVKPVGSPTQTRGPHD